MNKFSVKKAWMKLAGNLSSAAFVFVGAVVLASILFDMISGANTLEGPIFLLFLCFMILVASYGIFRTKQISTNLIEEAGFDPKVVNLDHPMYYSNATPASTLLKAIRRHKDSSPIKRILFQTYKLNNKYLIKALPENLSSTEEPIDLEILGYGSDDEAAFLKQSLFENLGDKVRSITVHTSESPLLRHINIVEAKDGESFIWYEPHHDDSHRYFCPRDGAFLLDVHDVRAVNDMYYREVVNSF